MFARSFLRTTTKAVISNAMFSTRITGRVKFFNQVKGFGFITPADGTPDVFVHWSAVKSDGYKGLKDEEEVEFEVSTDEASGKASAREVTGANGAQLECQKPRERREYNNDRNGDRNNDRSRAPRRDQY